MFARVFYGFNDTIKFITRCKITRHVSNKVKEKEKGEGGSRRMWIARTKIFVKKQSFIAARTLLSRNMSGQERKETISFAKITARCVDGTYTAAYLLCKETNHDILFIDFVLLIDFQNTCAY